MTKRNPYFYVYITAVINRSLFCIELQAGFEPATCSLQVSCTTDVLLKHEREFDRIRTCDRLIHIQELCQLSYKLHVVASEGLEPLPSEPESGMLSNYTMRHFCRYRKLLACTILIDDAKLQRVNEAFFRCKEIFVILQFSPSMTAR